MPIDSHHPLYAANLKTWRLNRAVTSGAEAMRADGARELVWPPLEGHRKDKGAYAEWVDNAYVYEATSRFAEAFLGILFYTQAVVEVPAPVEAAGFLEDVTDDEDRVDFATWLEQVSAPELAKVGRLGVWIDHPPVDPGLSRAEARRRRIMPTLRLVQAEAWINWGTVRRRGEEERITMVVIHDPTYEAHPRDRFKRELVEGRWTCLELVEAADLPAGERPDGAASGELYYRVQEWRRGGRRRDGQAQGKPRVVETRWPRVNGALMTDIPFVPWGSRRASVDVQPPPFAGLVEANVAHARNSASHEHSIIYLGCPLPMVFLEDRTAMTAVAQGAPGRAQVEGAGQEVVWPVGSRRIKVWPGKGKVETLKLGSDDVAAIREAMAAKKADMVQIAGRILASDKAVAEAAETEEVRREADRSVAMRTAHAIEAGAKRVLEWVAVLMGVDPEAARQATTVAVPTDVLARLSLEDALKLSQLVQEGGLLVEDLWNRLRLAGYIPSDRDDDAMRLAQQAEPPALRGAGGDLGGGPPAARSEPEEGPPAAQGDDEGGDG